MPHVNASPGRFTGGTQQVQMINPIAVQIVNCCLPFVTGDSPKLLCVARLVV